MSKPTQRAIAWWNTEFKRRKAERAERFLRREYGVCASCSGSGRYDHDGAPPCSACNGTGKTEKR